MEIQTPHPNRLLIDTFFEALSQKDLPKVRTVMSQKVTWSFLGEHPLAGTKSGIEEVIKFFEVMRGIMGTSKVRSKSLIIAENKKYVIECQHVKTHREDGNNIDHHVCVLWTIKKGKIASGKHFFSNPVALDTFFNKLASK